jgi:hypothetical protein
MFPPRQRTLHRLVQPCAAIKVHKCALQGPPQALDSGETRWIAFAEVTDLVVKVIKRAVVCKHL